MEGDAPFCAVSKAALSVPDNGQYVVVPQFEGMENARRDYEIINCSHLATTVIQDAATS